MSRGARAMLGAGALWALLCVLLGAGGHAPSVTLLPIPKRHYYFAQAAFVIPLLLLLWLLCVNVARRVAGWWGGQGNERELSDKMAISLAVPIVILVVLVDLVVYLAFGFDALGRAVRVTAPLAALASVALATHAIRSAYALSLGRALVAALVAIVTQAVVGGVALR